MKVNRQKDINASYFLEDEIEKQKSNAEQKAQKIFHKTAHHQKTPSGEYRKRIYRGFKILLGPLKAIALILNAIFCFIRGKTRHKVDENELNVIRKDSDETSKRHVDSLLFINQLMQDIKDKKKYTLPETSEIILSQFCKIRVFHQKKFITAVEKKLNTIKKNEELLSTHDLVQLLQLITQELNTLAIKKLKLKPEEQNRLIKLLEVAYQKDAQSRLTTLDMQENKEKYLAEMLSKDDYDKVKEYIPSFTFEDPFPEYLEAFFKKVDIRKILQDETMFEKVVQKLREFSADANLEEQVEEFLSQKSTERENSWLKNNEEALIYEFSQGQKGYDAILGKGICYAINYRWIRILLEKKPQEVIRDFSNPYNEVHKWIEDNYINRTEILREDNWSHDRFVQAQSALNAFLGREYCIPSNILKADKIKHKYANTYNNIEAAIDDVAKDPEFWIMSNFTVSIRAYSATGGHALGMQIDPAGNIFRFWDVNSGIYQYKSLEDLKQAFYSYLDVFYDNRYKTFQLERFSKKH